GGTTVVFPVPGGATTTARKPGSSASENPRSSGINVAAGSPLATAERSNGSADCELGSECDIGTIVGSMGQVPRAPCNHELCYTRRGKQLPGRPGWLRQRWDG